MKRNRLGRIIPDSTPDDQVYWTDTQGFTGHATLGLPEPTRRPPHNKGTGQRRPTMFKHFKVEDLLRPDERDAYVSLALLPRTTLPQLQAWLAARGHKVHRKSISNHRKWIWERHGKVVEQAKLATSAAELSCHHGPALADAAAWRGEQLLVEKLKHLSDTKPENVTLAELAELAKAITRLITARQQLERMRTGRAAHTKAVADEAVRLADAAAKPPLTEAERDERMKAKIAYIMQYGSADGFDDDNPFAPRKTDEKIRAVVRRMRRLVGFDDPDFDLKPAVGGEEDKGRVGQADKGMAEPPPPPQTAPEPAPAPEVMAPAPVPTSTAPSTERPWVTEKPWRP